MANLAEWQKITYVMPRMPFGDGKDGAATISSDPNTRTTFTGTDTQYTGTAGATSMSDGDLVKIIQTQGTGVGNWQWNMVVSGGGTTSLTFKRPLHYTFGTGAQIIKVPRYKTATVNTHSVTAWNGTTGGIEVICAKTSITISGTLSVAGNAGAQYPTPAGGFKGGLPEFEAPSNDQAYQGDGTVGAGTKTTTANGNGGGGGTVVGGGGMGGSGGSNGTQGTQGTGDGTAPAVGNTSGAADLTSMTFGGGGGGGAAYGADGGGYGGTGGGILQLISANVTVSGAATATGGNGITGSGANGGAAGAGGAGGSILIQCKTASLGTGLVTASGGGSGGYFGRSGGSGGDGRIAIHHYGTVTGTTTPTYTSVTDNSLKEKLSSSNYLF